VVASRDEVNGITERAVIRRNQVWENWGQGINTHEANGVVIEENVVHDSYSGNIYIHDASNIICERNFVYMNPNSDVYGHGSNVGILMGNEDDGAYASNIQVTNNIAYGNKQNFSWGKGEGNGITNVLIANNTFVNAYGSESSVIGNITISVVNHQNTRLVNNLVVQDGSLPVIASSSVSGIEYSHNLWSKNPPQKASGSGDVVGNPLLASSGGSPFVPESYQLSSGSPAINRALELTGLSVDYFKNLRDADPDIGAAEKVP
jgi:hypothetical protein